MITYAVVLEADGLPCPVSWMFATKPEAEAKRSEILGYMGNGEPIERPLKAIEPAEYAGGIVRITVKA